MAAESVVPCKLNRKSAASPDWLARPRLMALLDKAAHYTLTSLQAPAGSGKTTLLTQWCSHRTTPALIAWLKLEPAHNDPVAFFFQLINAIRTPYPQFDAYYLNQLADDVEFSVDAISESLRQGFAAVTEELYVLVDDYQFISDQAIHHTLAEVLHHLPHRVHFVIASRTHPPLQLSRLKLEDELLLLDIHDLRWEPEEIEALGQMLNGITLNSADLSQLAQTTEGWIAGIKLILLSSACKTRHSLQQPVNGNYPEVFQYLADAVLEQQPPALRNFLLQTAVLEVLEADLCNRILGIRNAQQQLEFLLANRLFVQSVEGERPAYRYHSLFRDFLRHRLQVEAPELIETLHRRAANWYVEKQRYVQALQLLRLIDDAAAMQKVLQCCAEEWIRMGALESLIEWVNELPEAMIVQQSEIVFPYVAGLVFSRRFNQANYFLTEVRGLLKQGKLQGRYADQGALQFLDCLLEMCLSDTDFLNNPVYAEPCDVAAFHDLRLFFQAMRSYHFLLNAQFDRAGVDAQRAKDFLQQNGHEYLSSFADLILVLTARAQGRMLEAVQLAELDYRQRSRSAMTPAWVNSATSIAVIRYEQNRVEDADKMLRDLIPRVSSACATEVISVNYCLLARIRFTQGHDREARRLLDYLARVLQHGNYERFASQIALELALRAVALDDRVAMERICREFHLVEKRHAGYWQNQTRYDECWERLGIAYALLLQLQGDFAAAESILTSLCNVTWQQGCVFRWAVCRANLALLYQRQQQTIKALQLLRETLRDSHLTCFNRTLFDEAPDAAHLLQAALDQGVIKPLPGLYLEMFGSLLCSPRPVSVPEPALALKLDPLTEKEKDILALLESGASNKEVSRCANISLATTKWHLKNIYAKLAVANRTEAVSKARQLNLL